MAKVDSTKKDLKDGGDAKVTSLAERKKREEAKKFDEKLDSEQVGKGLNTRFEFLGQFLHKEKGKYAMSAEKKIGSFLRRMIAENPWKIALCYYKIFDSFDAGTTEGQFGNFAEEIDQLLKNVVIVENVLKNEGENGATLRRIRKFIKSMKHFRAAAQHLAGMDSDERREVFNGKREGLSGEQEVMLAYMGLIGQKSYSLHKDSHSLMKKMREGDAEMFDALVEGDSSSDSDGDAVVGFS